MTLYEEWCETDRFFSSGDCLEGCGAFWQRVIFHTLFPNHVKWNTYIIDIWEIYSIIICLKLSGRYFRQKRIHVFCDNRPVVMVINTEKSDCVMLQTCLRKTAYQAAINKFEIRLFYFGAVFSSEKKTRIL